MSTKEVGEDFWWRIGGVAFDAMADATGGAWNDDKPYGVNIIRDGEAIDVAEAVYAQALRDVHEFLRDPVHWFLPLHGIKVFAAERGIELGGAGDE